MQVIHFIMLIIFIYLSIYVLYNLVLILGHYLISQRTTVLTKHATVFKILVPAHNEELLLGKLLRSITAQEYPEDLYDVLVIADNCTDQTAKIARQLGVRATERKNSKLVGKGFAIKCGLESLASEHYDAVLIIDADSIVETRLLKILDEAIQEGARIIQCYNGLANPDDSWFTRLMDVSRTFGNEILEPAKEKFGLSSHLMGNGMSLHRRL